jgi:hypothetical protein
MWTTNSGFPPVVSVAVLLTLLLRPEQVGLQRRTERTAEKNRENSEEDRE